MVVCNEDEAGPFQSIPQAGFSWQLLEHGVRQPHEYVRGAPAKLLTLFHPASGQVRVQGVTSSSNAVLHPWLKQELINLLDALPLPKREVLALPGSSAAEGANELLCSVSSSEKRCLQWSHWQAGLTERFTLAQELPPLRMLLILDNLAGHKSLDNLAGHKSPVTRAPPLFAG